MELLTPNHPPLRDPTRIPLPGFSSPASFDLAETFISPEIVEDDSLSISGGEKVYIAIGKSVDKALSLLQWSLKQFNCREICLLHVHQPSPLIPTLLGKLPVSQVNDKMVSAYRKEEKEKTKKLLDYYLSAFAGTKVKASILVTVADEVQKGILQLADRLCVKKLVIGAVPDNCLKTKRSSSKATYASRNAPSFCEIWFVNKGKHVWVREASENQSSVPSIIRSGTLNPENPRSITMVCNGITDWVYGEHDNFEFPLYLSLYQQSSSGLVNGGLDLAPERKLSDVNNKVKVFDSAHAREVKLREENEDQLKATIHEQGNLLEEKEELIRKLHETMTNVVFLDSRAQLLNSRREELSEEFKLLETSIASLRLENQRIRRQKMEAVRWLDRWSCQGKSGAANCTEIFEFSNGDFPELAEFSLVELQTATCDFSESFKIGQGGNGCVYKGEIMGRTVAIKKLHTHNMQGQSEFQQEVRVLSKLQHPHLVTLLGYCSEAWSLVYEYLPNGSLQERFFRKANISPLPWKTRTRIMEEISSALCFLHSSKPKKIVHGDLKPENILLDSKLSCKICDFGICRLITGEDFCCPNFHRNTELKVAFPITDPEFRSFGVSTSKSDIYSFGIIILQLLTGKSPVGLVGEVRKAVSLGKLESVLDSSAGEWSLFVARRLADIGLQCCESYRRDPPDITPSLVRELEQLNVSVERPVPSFFLCPIRQEIMHDPQIAADGFTYEAEAIREWFANGHETSPMTNLKLSHLHLTPNHGLRLAIQDWLCKS